MNLKAIVPTLSKKVSKVFVLFVTLAIPMLGMAQIGNPGNPGDDGTNPDGVPFDGRMTVIFLVVAIVFAAIVTVRAMRKKSVATA